LAKPRTRRRAARRTIGAAALASRNAEATGRLALAAGQVIAERTALGLAALADPAKADYAELSRMWTEKMLAFSTMGLTLAQHAVTLAGRMGSHAGGPAAASLSFGLAGMRAYAAALQPLHRVAAANARRLRR